MKVTPKKIVIVLHHEDYGLPNFVINADGVVRGKEKTYGRECGKGEHYVDVCVVTNEGKINDAQCQATVSLALACQVNYNIPSENIECQGITWEELLRRG